MLLTDIKNSPSFGISKGGRGARAGIRVSEYGYKGKYLFRDIVGCTA